MVTSLSFVCSLNTLITTPEEGFSPRADTVVLITTSSHRPAHTNFLPHHRANCEARVPVGCRQTRDSHSSQARRSDPESELGSFLPNMRQADGLGLFCRRRIAQFTFTFFTQLVTKPTGNLTKTRHTLTDQDYLIHPYLFGVVSFTISS